jgi:FAD/FMN-containing dehydrogenase
MSKKLTRKDFLKLSSASGIAFLLASCGISNSEEEKQTTVDSSPLAVADTVAVDVDAKSENVTYITIDDAQYQELNQGFNKRFNKKPQVIALCKNTEGVSEAVKYAIQNDLQISVKSGGHSFEAFSSNEGGLVINLSLLNMVVGLEDDRIIAQSGCTLSSLYDAILPHKRIIPAGSCGTVGIGGLTLGGGYGFFSRKYGLTCDSLNELTFIDGKGEIHRAKNDDELLWACRGAGNGNFGIVTDMTFKTYPAPETFQSHRFKAFKLDATRAASILEKWFEISAKLPPACFGAFVLNHKTLTILITNYEEHTPEIQDLLDALTPLCDKTSFGTPLPLARALKTFYGIQTPIYFKNASAGLYKDFEQIRGCITEILEKVIQTNGLIYQVNTLGGKINDPQFESYSAYAHRALPFLSELQAYWENPAKQEPLMATFEEIQTVFRNNGINAQYINYPDINFANWQTAYYGSNYVKLQEIKKKYDPENRIRHEQSINLEGLS